MLDLRLMTKNVYSNVIMMMMMMLVIEVDLPVKECSLLLITEVTCDLEEARMPKPR
jgi:hypothetical protein